MLGSLVLTSQGGPGGPPPPGVAVCQQECELQYPDPSPGSAYFTCVEDCINAAMPIDGSLILLFIVGILFASVEIFKGINKQKTPM